jgi:hypothetical protein
VSFDVSFDRIGALGFRAHVTLDDSIRSGGAAAKIARTAASWRFSAQWSRSCDPPSPGQRA